MSNTTKAVSDFEKFQSMVSKFPDLAVYWNFERREVSKDVLTGDISTLPLSSGEKILMTFFLSVWKGQNVDFDITRAAGILSMENKRLIADWFLDPFWP